MCCTPLEFSLAPGLCPSIYLSVFLSHCLSVFVWVEDDEIVDIAMSPSFSSLVAILNINKMLLEMNKSLMKHLHNNSKNLNLKHQGTNISTFVSIDTAGSGLKFVNKFKFLPTDSLGRTLFDKRDSKVVQVKINPMYASRMHGER